MTAFATDTCRDAPEVGATSDATTAVVVVVDEDPLGRRTVHEMLGERRHAWSLHVVENGRAALALAGRLAHVDVLVADSALSEMTTAELLTEVRQRSPQTARIVMSGDADRRAVLDLLGSAHQYLTKPLDAGVLAELVEHVRCKGDLRDPVRSLIGEVDRLPSPPALFQRLTTMMASPDWTIDEIAVEIVQDVGMTAEILRLVNSACFGMTGVVTSINRAISLVGVDMIRYVVLGNRLFTPDTALQTWLDLERLDQRSKAVGFGARSLALREGCTPTAAAVAYLTGMVSEIGLLVMARIPDVSPSIAQPLNTGTYLGAERAIFGGDRFSVGSRLLGLWRFDPSTIAAVGSLADPAADVPDGGLTWCLQAARRLVLDDGLEPEALAQPYGADAATDEAIDRVRSEMGLPTLG